MNTRNEQYNADGSIDCEYEHPEFGWVPYTASEDDVEQLGRDIFVGVKGKAAAYVAPFSPDPPTLSQRRQAQMLVLRAVRDEVVNAPIDGVRVNRVEDREATAGAIENWALFGSPATIPWVLHDNSTRMMSQADLQAVKDTFIIRKMQAFAHYQTLLAQLAVSNNPEEIVWTTGS